MTFPAIGTFLVPQTCNGYGLAYCMKLDEIVRHPGWVSWLVTRWGLRDGQPFDDGHRSRGFILQNLVPVRRALGLWEDRCSWPAQAWSGRVRYWREFTARPARPMRPMLEQLCLFAEAA